MLFILLHSPYVRFHVYASGWHDCQHLFQCRTVLRFFKNMLAVAVFVLQDDFTVRLEVDGRRRLGQYNIYSSRCTWGLEYGIRCGVGFPIMTYLWCGLLQSYKSSISITSTASNGRSLYLMVILMVNSISNHSISVLNSYCVEFQAMCWFLLFWLTHLGFNSWGLEAWPRHNMEDVHLPQVPSSHKNHLSKLIYVSLIKRWKKAGVEPPAHGEPRPNSKQMYHNQDNQENTSL